MVNYPRDCTETRGSCYITCFGCKIGVDTVNILMLNCAVFLRVFLLLDNSSPKL
jgi:hypothetical protein